MKTAVEWLENEMQKTYAFNQNDFDMFKQAKELEKQQIIDAVDSQRQLGCEKGKHYYNETFNK